MTKKVLVLTKSDKHNDTINGGYCVAGIDLETSQWIRLVGPHSHFKITNDEAIYENGIACYPLDIIEVEAEKIDAEMVKERNQTGWSKDEFLIYPESYLSIQPENHIVSGKFRFVKKVTPQQAVAMLPADSSKYIFMNADTRLSTYESEINNCSLKCVKVNSLVLYPDYDNDGNCRNHFKAKFWYNGNLYQNITYTASDYSPAKLGEHQISLGDRYLVLSLGEAYHGYNYKLIANSFNNKKISFTPSPMIR